MSTNAIPSVGTILSRGDGAATEVFAPISEATAITPLSGSTETLDASDLSSVWRQKLPGMLDGGQLQFTVHLIPGSTGHADLRSDWKSRTLRNFQIEYPDGTIDQVRGFVSGVSPTVQMNSTIQCSFTVEIAEEPDFDVAP